MILNLRGANVTGIFLKFGSKGIQFLALLHLLTLLLSLIPGVGRGDLSEDKKLTQNNHKGAAGGGERVKSDVGEGRYRAAARFGSRLSYQICTVLSVGASFYTSPSRILLMLLFFCGSFFVLEKRTNSGLQSDEKSNKDKTEKHTTAFVTSHVATTHESWRSHTPGHKKGTKATTALTKCVCVGCQK
uniref:Uncharacterized protein n=1 Tax=Trypanosoma congolense (strain IL3000) TaxID=1068625 RepID=G0UN46_TRYCI|nr:hypothetical protein TCIL3000_6_320 [Trypanosoma congolense IL3000]